MIAVRDIAWAAGFLEGEGSFSSSRTCPLVCAAQVQREPLERLQRLFGGTIRERKPKSGQQPYYDWRLYGNRSIAVMQTILVFMSPRRTERIIEIVTAWRDRGPRGSFQRKQTHCRNGHEFTPENTNVKNGRYRECRACMAAARRRYYERIKGA